MMCRPCGSGCAGSAGPGTPVLPPVLPSALPPAHPRLRHSSPLGFLIDLTRYKLPNLVVIAVKNGTLKDSISVYLPLINIGLLSLDLIYLPLEQVHYYVLGRYDIFMEIWGLFMEYIKIK